VSPLLGFLLGSLLMVVVAWISGAPRRCGGPLVPPPAAGVGRLYSLGHGGNDAQKTIGIIWLLLIAAGYHPSRQDAARLGDLELLHRHRPGHHVRRLAHRQDHGPAHHQAQAGGRLLRRDRRRDHAVPGLGLGMPVSTTHTITGAIFGVGSVRNASAVRWGLAGNIVWPGSLTIPATAFIAAVFYGLSLLLF
jgi:PiT family inorganic phosphate transporter